MKFFVNGASKMAPYRVRLTDDRKGVVLGAADMPPLGEDPRFVLIDEAEARRVLAELSAAVDGVWPLDDIVDDMPPVVVPEPPPLIANTAKAWWSGDFETFDISRYYSVLGDKARITFDRTIKAGGAASARFELRPGQLWTDDTNRLQFRGINGPNSKHMFYEGDDLYFAFGVYIDPSTTIGSSIANPWRALLAWPSSTDGKFSPLKYYLQRETPGRPGANPSGIDSLCVGGDLGYSGASDLTRWRITNPVKAAWHRFVTHIRFSADPTKGLFEHWYKRPDSDRYVRQAFEGGLGNTMHCATLSAANSNANLRMGIYRNKAFTTVDVVHYDDAYIYLNPADAGVL